MLNLDYIDVHMSNDDIDSLSITEREYSALMDIRGLQEKAHMMVMTSSRESSGHYILRGSERAFDELAHDLSEEIEFDLSPKSSRRQLAKLYSRLRPDDFF